jgi:hypothetical protein
MWMVTGYSTLRVSRPAPWEKWSSINIGDQCTNQEVSFFYSLGRGGGGGDTTHCTPATIFQVVPAPGDDVIECGAGGGTRIGRGNWNTKSKPASVPCSPARTQYDLTWNRNRAAAVSSRRLSAWATARPTGIHYFQHSKYLPEPVCQKAVLRQDVRDIA